MNTKLLLLAFSVAAISSCSTAYKSGQTPDDVYYSPAKFEENKDKDDKEEERNDQAQQTTEDRRIRQTVRDRRWRVFDNDDYTFNNSPYNHWNCNQNNYGYYYNPKYYPTPIFTTTPVVNTVPRKINLNAYQGYNTATAKTVTTKNNTVVTTSPKYNNNNNNSNASTPKKQTFVGKIFRAITSKEGIPPNTSESNSGNSNTRSFPSSNTKSSSSSNGSSGGSSSGSSVTRPTRGGQ